MSPLNSMQADLERSSDLKITLQKENFIKYFVSLIRLLSSIFTGAVGRILANFQPWSYFCSGHTGPNNFWPKLILLISSQILHSLTKSHCQKDIWLQWCTLGTHSPFRICFANDPQHCNRNQEWWRATEFLLSKITSPKLVGRCANTKWYQNLQIDFAWMLAICSHWAYFPSKCSISEPNWWILNCLNLNLGDFQMSPFWLTLNHFTLL